MQILNKNMLQNPCVNQTSNTNTLQVRQKTNVCKMFALLIGVVEPFDTTIYILITYYYKYILYIHERNILYILYNIGHRFAEICYFGTIYFKASYINGLQCPKNFEKYVIKHVIFVAGELLSIKNTKMCKKMR